MAWRSTRSMRLALCLATVVASAGLIVHSDQRLVMFAAAIAGALALFVMRETDRAAYGAVEILFALAVLWRAAGDAGAPVAPGESADVVAIEWDVVLLQIGAATYVLVRGFDNFARGLEARRARRGEAENGGP